MKKMIALCLMLISMSISMTGCNTMQGFGKDVKKVGEKVEDAARK